jgi:hypothetical protein
MRLTARAVCETCNALPGNAKQGVHIGRLRWWPLFNPTAVHGGMRYSFSHRSRSEFPTTDSELRLMAALAQMGLMRTPSHG